MRIPKVLAVLILLVCLGYVAFQGYMIYWRYSFCVDLARLNAHNPATDFNIYLMRKQADEEVCQDGPDVIGIFISSIGIISAIQNLPIKSKEIKSKS